MLLIVNTSSAYSLTKDSMPLGKSFMKSWKSKGPKTESCGTPERTVDGVLKLLLMITYCFLSVRNSLIHSRYVLHIP